MPPWLTVTQALPAALLVVLWLASTAMPQIGLCAAEVSGARPRALGSKRMMLRFAMFTATISWPFMPSRGSNPTLMVRSIRPSGSGSVSKAGIGL
jgi:hypothetical protein